MTSQNENAETFVRIWRMETPADIAGIYNELHGTPPEIGLEVERELQDSLQGSGIRIYGGTPEDYRRRVEGEHGQLVLGTLRESLEPTYFTEPCKESLVDFARTNLADGRPSERNFPLSRLGIYPEEERYDPYEPNADLRGIEGKLLEEHNLAMTYITRPDVMQPMIDLNGRWNEAYNEKYKPTDPEPMP